MQNSLPTLKDRVLGGASTWLPKTLCFLDTILVLGTSIQLGIHFWPPSALIYGIRVDYLSPTLYLLDILLLVSLLLHHRFSLTSFFRSLSSALIILALTNLLFSLTPLQSSLWWLRLVLWVSWLRFLPRHRLLPYLLLFWLGSLCLLGLVQIMLGHTLQGPFYWLGERRLSLGQPGIALQEIFGAKYLRAYSLFSHPNIFAGWSVLVTIFISLISPSLAFISATLSLFSIILTASRSAALALLLFFLLHWRHLLRSQLLVFLLVVFCLVPFFTRPDQTSLPRFALFSNSLITLWHHPFFGSGVLGSFFMTQNNSSLRLFQPDHFSPTLLLSWLGLAGLLELLVFVKKHFPPPNKTIALIPLLPLFILDHYFLTSVAGLAMCLIVLYTSLYETSSQNRRRR